MAIAAHSSAARFRRFGVVDVNKSTYVSQGTYNERMPFCPVIGIINKSGVCQRTEHNDVKKLYYYDVLVSTQKNHFSEKMRIFVLKSEIIKT